MPLTETQRHRLEERLLEERALVLRDLDDFAGAEAVNDRQDRSADLSKVPIHNADLGTDVNEEETDASLATRRSHELMQIDEALERLASRPETYGIDEISGEDIPYERLELIPWARTGVKSRGKQAG